MTSPLYLDQRRRQPPLIGPEHGYLSLAAVCLPLVLTLATLQQVGALTVVPGTYGILSALTAVGGCGWLVRSGDTRRRRDIALVHERLSDMDARLAQIALQGRPAGSSALVYVGRAGAADGARDTVPLDGRGHPDYWRVYSDVLEDLSGLERPDPER